MKFWNRSIRPVHLTSRLSTSALRPNRNGRLRLEELKGRTLLSTYTISEVVNPFTGVKGVSVQVNNNLATVTNNPTTTVVVNTASGTNTVNILNTSDGFPIKIAGQGQDTVNVGTNGSVQGIVGSVSFGPSATFTAININDASDTASDTATFSSYTPSGDTAWGSITGLTAGAIDYRYANTGSVYVNASTGSDTFNVQATGVPLDLNNGGIGTVNVGNAGSVQGIAATLTVQDTTGTDALNVSDSADTTARNVTLCNDEGVAFWGEITGLAPATIFYEDSHTSLVNVTTGTGSDTVNVQETSVPLILDDQGAGTVNVGNADSVQGIAASLTVYDTAGSDGVNINDSADTTARNVTLSNQGGIAFWGLVTGLAPATISYEDASTNLVDLTTGTGSDTVNVQQASVSLNLDDEGAGTVNVGNAGSVQGITATLMVYDTSGSDAVNINDSADATARNVTMGNYGGVAVWGTVTGLAPTTIFYADATTRIVDVTTGTGSDTVNVQQASVQVVLDDEGAGTVNVGNAGSVQSIVAQLTVEDTAGSDAVNINDSADATARNVTMGNYLGVAFWGTITGLAPATIFYEEGYTSSLSVTTGTASDTVNVQATGAPTHVIGEWDDTVNVGNGGTVSGIADPLYIDNPPWYNTININDGSDTTARTVTLSSYTPSGDSAWGAITGLAPAAIDYRFADTASVNLSTGTVSDTVNVQATGVATHLTGGWNDTVNIGNGGTVSGILGILYLENPPAYNTLNVNDGYDTTVRTVTLSSYTPSGDSAWGAITGLAPAAIDYRYADTTSVNLTTGDVSDTVNVQATGAPTHFIGGWNDTVSIGNGGTVSGILGTLYLTNPPAYNTLSINDGSDTTARTVTLSSYTPSGDSAWGAITGLAPAAIDYRYADTTAVNLITGSGGVTVNVQTTSVTTNLYSTSTQTVNVGNNSSVAGIDGTLFVNGWHTTLNLDDSSDSAVRTADLSTINPSAPIPEGSITGLAPAPIEFVWANMTGGVNATANWSVHWDVNPNALEPQVGLVQVSDDGIVINAQSSGNWSGYVAESSFSNPQSNSVSAVYGGWTVPEVTGSTTGSFRSAIWVGIDGANNNTVEQIGTEQDFVNGTASYQAWWEMYSSNGSNTDGEKYEYPIPTSQMPINPGDSIYAYVEYLSSGTRAGQFQLTIVNNTQDKVFTTYETSSQTQSPVAARNSAEWIVETPTYNGSYATLPNFGYVTFTSATAVINGVFGAINAATWQSEALDIDPNGTAADVTTTLYNSGESFQVDQDVLNLLSDNVTLAMADSANGGGVVGGASVGTGSRTAVNVEPGNPSGSSAGTAGSATVSVVDRALAELVALEEALPGRAVVAQGGDEGDGTPLGGIRLANLIAADPED